MAALHAADLAADPEAVLLAAIFSKASVADSKAAEVILRADVVAQTVAEEEEDVVTTVAQTAVEQEEAVAVEIVAAAAGSGVGCPFAEARPKQAVSICELEATTEGYL